MTQMKIFHQKIKNEFNWGSLSNHYWKKTDGDLIEFKEVGKDAQKMKLKDIIKIIIEQKEKIDFSIRKRNYF